MINNIKVFIIILIFLFFIQVLIYKKNIECWTIKGRAEELYNIKKLYQSHVDEILKTTPVELYDVDIPLSCAAMPTSPNSFNALITLAIKCAKDIYDISSNSNSKSVSSSNSNSQSFSNSNSNSQSFSNSNSNSQSFSNSNSNSQSFSNSNSNSQSFSNSNSNSQSFSNSNSNSQSFSNSNSNSQSFSNSNSNSQSFSNSNSNSQSFSNSYSNSDFLIASNSNSNLNFFTTSNSLFNNSISDSKSGSLSNSNSLVNRSISNSHSNSEHNVLNNPMIDFNSFSFKSLNKQTKLKMITSLIKRITAQHNTTNDTKRKKLFLTQINLLNGEYRKILKGK